MIARRFLFAQFRVHFVQINFADWHFVGWILRVLEVDVDFDDVYVLGHAKRVGLVAENTPVGTLVGLLPSVKNDLRYELEALRDCGFANYFRIIEGDTVTRNG